MIGPTIILGDVAEGTKWWSAAHFIKVELERIYTQNNAFMQTWKFLAADVKVHAVMRAGTAWAFIYAEGRVQVCWSTGVGSEFISFGIPEGGTTPSVIRTQNNLYQSSTLTANIVSQYWVNKNFTDAISVEGARIYYMGVGYSGDEGFQELDIRTVKAMHLGKNLILLYQTFTSSDYFLVRGGLTIDGISVTHPPINISVAGNEIIFASFGGDDLLWTISRDIVAGIPGVITYIRCYKLSIVSGGVLTATQAAEATIDCTQYGAETDTGLIVTLDDLNLSGIDTLIRDYKRLNLIQDIFLQNDSLSIGVKNVLGTDTYIQTWSADLSDMVQPGYTFSHSSMTTSDVFVTSTNSTPPSGFPTEWTNSRPLGIALGAPTVAENSTICSKGISAHKYELDKDVNDEYVLNLTTPFVEAPLDVNTTTENTSLDREDLNFQYADGINNQYAVFHEDWRGSNLVRQVIITGDYAVITDLDVQTISGTHPPQSFWTTPGVTRNSNPSELSSNQGFTGAFDGRIYLLQTFTPITPFYDHLAFSNAGILIRERGDNRSLTVGKV